MREISWKHVTLILGFFATIAALSVTGHDTGTFVLVGMGILGALGLVVNQVSGAKEQTAAVQVQTNGNQTRLLDIVESQGRMLAAMQPASAAPLDEVHATTPTMP